MEILDSFGTLQPMDAKNYAFHFCAVVYDDRAHHDTPEEALANFGDDFNYPSPAPDLEDFAVPQLDISLGSLSNRLEDMDVVEGNYPGSPLKEFPDPDSQLLDATPHLPEQNQRKVG